MSGDFSDSYPEGRGTTRLQLSLVKKQQALVLARKGCCLVICVVWTMFVFHLCSDMITEWSSFCLAGQRVALNDAVKLRSTGGTPRSS